MTSFGLIEGIVVLDNYKIERRVELTAYVALGLSAINLFIILLLSMIILQGGTR